MISMRPLSLNQMKAEIIKELPGLEASLSTGDHISATGLLRQYIYDRFVWSNDGLQVKKWCNGDISRLTVPQISFLFDALEIGVLCGGVAVYLAKTYELFGYQASTYNYGIAGVSTHVATLVAVPDDDDGNKVIIQDGTFNLGYSIKDTGDRSFFGILELLREGGSNDIVMDKGRIREKTIYFSDNAEGLQNIKIYKDMKILHEEPVAARTALTGMPIFYARGDLDFHTSYLRRNEMNILKALSERLGKDMAECSVLELMLFPLNVPLFKDRALQSRVNKLKRKLLKSQLY